MRVSMQLPVAEPARIGECADAIERAGFDACFVTDHPAAPRSWLEHGGHLTLDPFAALACAAATTTTLQLHTHCLIPAYRHPLMTVKSITTLQDISGGRVILGVAVGYLEEEFTALGVPFAERAARFDDALGVIRDAVDVPIWVGGNSPAAMRRAIEHGTGWAPFPAAPRMASAVGTSAIADTDALAAALDRFRARAAAARRTEPFDICFTPFSHPAHLDVADPDAFVAEARQLQALGVTWLAVHLPAPTVDAFVENVAAFAQVHA